MKNLADPLDETSPNAIVTPLVLPGVSSAVAKGKAIDPEVERLYATNDVYDDNIDEWMFLLKSYEGGPAYVGTDTLFKHQRENQADYNDRLARANFWNYCAPLADFVPEFIFSTPIERMAPAGLSADFKLFEKNVDRAGASVDSFMRLVTEYARLFGVCFIGVDKPVHDADNMSKAEEEELGLRPYFYLVTPLEILDSHVNDAGRYEYIKRHQSKREMVAFGEFANVDVFTEWMSDVIKISHVVEEEVDGVKVKRVSFSQVIPNQWGVVPLIPLFHRRSKAKRDQPVSFLRDIALQNRHIFNQTSLIDDFLFRQAFNILALSTSSRVPTKQDHNREIGTSNVLEVPEDARHFPAYVSPPVDPASFIQSERAKVIEEMYRTAAQDLGVQLFGGASQGSQSGDASRQSFGRVIPVIARLADACQLAEVQAFSLWAKMLGKSWDGGKIAYRDDYSLANTMTLILQLSSILNNLKIMSPTFIKEEWKRVIREFDGHVPREKMDEIIAEINDLDDDDILALYSKKQDVVATEGLPAVGNMIQGQEQAMLATDENRSANGDKGAVSKEVAGDDERYPQGKKMMKDSSD